MRHFLFEFKEGNYAGEEFIVGAETGTEAAGIALGIAQLADSVNERNVPRIRYICELSEEEAEASGLDEY